MSTFVLIHGAWHGSWCWEKVIPLLKRAGHEVVAPDLPGRGDDNTPASEVTLEGYSGCVVEILDTLSEPVVLVGHSMGGVVISEAAERRPETIKLLVYLTGFLLPNGTSLLDMAQTDQESIVSQSTDVDGEKGISKIRAGMAKDLFYGDCSKEDAEWATKRLTSEPLVPLATPISVSKEGFGRLRKAYIECLQDRGIGPATQRRMYAETPCEKVVSMDTSHSPFLSRPEELVENLNSLAGL